MKPIKDIETFIIKHTVIASALTWLVGSQIRQLSVVIVETLIDPLFSIDLNKDGKPDLKQLDKYITEFLGFKFPIGKVILESLRTILTLLLLYLFLSFFIRNTNLLQK